MVKVWLVYVGDQYSAGSIHGVFSSEENAKTYVKSLPSFQKLDADIQEFEVDAIG